MIAPVSGGRSWLVQFVYLIGGNWLCPPLRPLDRYEVRVEDGQIWVGKLYRVS